MKKQIVLFVATGILFLFFQSFRPEPPSESVFPDEITTILKTSCYDCHYTGASSEKALKAVNFADWEDYRLTKQIGLLGDMGKVVEEKKMPPGKYLENKPDAELSEAQIKLLADWTKQESEKLMQAD
ncbi:MAG: heme-binding domain-containing protein [Bacteroidota bacterium]|nr:heme-binding domain-containing protein [Bacteroidota bacterium]